MASVWEISIKYGYRLGKSALPEPADVFVPTQLVDLQVSLLPIELPHALGVSTLPLHHRDPFDRLLVAQSLIESLPMISADGVLDVYGLVRLW
jgi:PIN domain nuclease of toxin-antitoxin system